MTLNPEQLKAIQARVGVTPQATQPVEDRVSKMQAIWGAPKPEPYSVAPTYKASESGKVGTDIVQNIGKSMVNIPSSAANMAGQYVVKPVAQLAEAGGIAKDIYGERGFVEGSKDIAAGFADTGEKILRAPGEFLMQAGEKQQQAKVQAQAVSQRDDLYKRYIEAKKLGKDTTHLVSGLKSAQENVDNLNKELGSKEDRFIRNIDVGRDIAKVGIERPLEIPTLLYGGETAVGKDIISGLAKPVVRGADTSLLNIASKAKQQVSTITEAAMSKLPASEKLQGSLTNLGPEIFTRVKDPAYAEKVKKNLDILADSSRNPYHPLAQETAAKIDEVVNTAKTNFSNAAKEYVASGEKYDIGARVNEIVNSVDSFKAGKDIKYTQIRDANGKLAGFKLEKGRYSPFADNEVRLLNNLIGDIRSAKGINADQLLALDQKFGTYYKAISDAAGPTPYHAAIMELKNATQDRIRKTLTGNLKSAYEEYAKVADMKSDFGNKLVDGQGYVKDTAESFLSNLSNQNKGAIQAKVKEYSDMLGIDLVSEAQAINDAKKFMLTDAPSGGRVSDFLKTNMFTGAGAGMGMTVGGPIGAMGGGTLGAAIGRKFTSPKVVGAMAVERSIEAGKAGAKAVEAVAPTVEKTSQSTPSLIQRFKETPNKEGGFMDFGSMFRKEKTPAEWKEYLRKDYKAPEVKLDSKSGLPLTDSGFVTLKGVDKAPAYFEKLRMLEVERTGNNMAKYHPEIWKRDKMEEYMNLTNTRRMNRQSSFGNKVLQPERASASYKKAEQEVIREKLTGKPITQEISAEKQKILDDLYASGSYTGKNELGKDVFGGKINKDKRLDVIIGPPASGKSEVLTNPLSKKYGSHIVDSDRVKPRLVGYEGGKGASKVHKESSDLTEAGFLAQAMLKGDNIVVPMIGKTEDKLQRLALAAKEYGYNVHLSLLHVNPETALARATERAQKTGRSIPTDYILNEVGNKPLENYNKFRERNQGLFDSFTAFDNEVPRGENPLIFDATEKSDVIDTIADKAFELTKKNGGVTVKLNGDIPTKGFSVADSKATERSIDKGAFNKTVVSNYVRQNIKSLIQSGRHFGMWEDGGRIYFDIPMVLKDVEKAKEIGRKADQIGIFDLENFETIRLKE